jgi:hypothetical protein
MNPNNYVTQPMAQRLVDAGIVLETEKELIHVVDGSWYLVDKNKGQSGAIDKRIPAPMFTEIWRELPEYARIEKQAVNLLAHACLITGTPTFVNNNPCEAAAELLIFCEGEKINDPL